MNGNANQTIHSKIKSNQPKLNRKLSRKTMQTTKRIYIYVFGCGCGAFSIRQFAAWRFHFVSDSPANFALFFLLLIFQNGFIDKYDDDKIHNGSVSSLRAHTCPHSHATPISFDQIGWKICDNNHNLNARFFRTLFILVCHINMCIIIFSVFVLVVCLFFIFALLFFGFHNISISLSPRFCSIMVHLAAKIVNENS